MRRTSMTLSPNYMTYLDVIYICQDCETETFETDLREPCEGYGTVCACGSDNLTQKEN